MTAAIKYGDKIVWGSNGQIEDIMVALIKNSPNDSRLLRTAIEAYRGFYSGIVIDISDDVQTHDEKKAWMDSIVKSLNQIKHSGRWSEIGVAWIDENFSAIRTIAE